MICLLLQFNYIQIIKRKDSLGFEPAQLWPAAIKMAQQCALLVSAFIKCNGPPRLSI